MVSASNRNSCRLREHCLLVYVLSYDDYGHIMRYYPRPRAEGAAQGNARDSSGSRGGRRGGRVRRGSRGKQGIQEAEDGNSSPAPDNSTAASRDDSKSVGSSVSERLTYVEGSVGNAGAVDSPPISAGALPWRRVALGTNQR